MKKVLLISGLLACLLPACKKTDVVNSVPPTANSNKELAISNTNNLRKCGAMEVLKAHLTANPALRQRMNYIENFTSKYLKAGDKNKTLRRNEITIPVVVNVLYQNDEENISLEQIQSQIDVLNEDYNAVNSDYKSVPDLFSKVKADMGIRFKLEQVNRKVADKDFWYATDDAMKKSAEGGIDPTCPTTKLNMWVVNKIIQGPSTVMGYAQFPGDDSTTDGVVIAYNYFGRTGTVSPPYDRGRTATHEVGHWLNLRHIWGDEPCGDDFVFDTPQHNGPNYSCPAFPYWNACTNESVEMTMNYMDYTDDACMYMFTAGQRDRALAVLAPGGPRATFMP